MVFNAEKHHRRSIRLAGYDYSRSGAYFVTICTYNRECRFGMVENGHMLLNQCGNLIVEEWKQTQQIRSYVSVDAFVVMPNHVHGIIVMKHCMGDRQVAHACEFPHGFPRGPKSQSLGAIMAGFKSACTTNVNQMEKTPERKLWQRNYWERIIRNQAEYNHLRFYILTNPARWQEDSLYKQIQDRP